MFVLYIVNILKTQVSFGENIKNEVEATYNPLQAFWYCNRKIKRFIRKELNGLDFDPGHRVLIFL